MYKLVKLDKWLKLVKNGLIEINLLNTQEDLCAVHTIPDGHFILYCRIFV